MLLLRAGGGPKNGSSRCDKKAATILQSAAARPSIALPPGRRQRKPHHRAVPVVSAAYDFGYRSLIQSICLPRNNSHMNQGYDTIDASSCLCAPNTQSAACSTAGKM